MVLKSKIKNNCRLFNIGCDKACRDINYRNLSKATLFFLTLDI